MSGDYTLVKIQIAPGMSDTFGVLFEVISQGRKVGEVLYTPELAAHRVDAWMISQPENLARAMGRYPTKETAAEALLAALGAGHPVDNPYRRREVEGSGCAVLVVLAILGLAYALTPALKAVVSRSTAGDAGSVALF
jgi:hypothetical protein